jgi:hypothetical protein
VAPRYVGRSSHAALATGYRAVSVHARTELVQRDRHVSDPDPCRMVHALAIAAPGASWSEFRAKRTSLSLRKGED